MHRLSPALVTSCTLLALLGRAAPAPAEPIPVTITEGSLSMMGAFGTLSISGDHGFTLVSGVDVVGGLFGPYNCLHCPPGSAVRLDSVWGGSDLRGTATFQGVTYTRIGGVLPGDAGGIVTFSGSTIAPLDGLLASSSAPFLFNGQFHFPAADPSEPGAVASLFGSGLATVQFHRPSLDQHWDYASATYQFDATPVPEPGTLLLFGTALAALAARRRRPG